MGTRAEAIKLAPVIRELERHRRGVQTVVITTAQHREMLSQALEAFDILPHIDLGLAAPRSQLAEFTGRALKVMTGTFVELQPDIVLVQGDNTAVFAAALAARYAGIPVAHVDGGVRSPSPRSAEVEELNRRLTGVLGDLQFVGTAGARENLLAEGVHSDRIVVTGSPTVDAIRLTPMRTLFSEPALNLIPWEKRRVVTVTMHRQENLGEPMLNVCHALAELTAIHGDLQLVLPLHLNPRVRELLISELDGVPRLEIVDPLGYHDMLDLMRRSIFVMTDSGTIQEECAVLGRPVLILRKYTDRPEVVASGFGRVVGTESVRVIEAATRLLDDDLELDRMSRGDQPYGNGLAAVHIAQALMSRAPRTPGGGMVAEGPAVLPPRRAVEL